MEASLRQHRNELDRTFEGLRLDALTTYRRVRRSPHLESEGDWVATVLKAAEDIRSGKALIEHLGADALLDTPEAGMILALRRDLIDERGSSSAPDYMLIDMAVIAYANAMRVQRMIGNLMLITQSDMFGQESLRVKLKTKHGMRVATGFAVGDHLDQLVNELLPLVERFQRMLRKNLKAIQRKQNLPSINVERAEPLRIVLTEPFD